MTKNHMKLRKLYVENSEMDAVEIIMYSQINKKQGKRT